MPFYEYQCDACGHDVEVLQKMSDAPLTDCPACGKPELRKLISAAGFRLKGGGWYESDFKKSDQRNLASAEGKAPASDDAKPVCGAGACPTCAD
jgi:putative FmdB family regulatory protein